MGSRSRSPWSDRFIGIAIGLLIGYAVVEVAMNAGSNPPGRPLVLSLLPALLTFGIAATLWRRWWGSWCLVAAQGLLLLFSWLYVVLLPFAPESRAVSHLFEGTPLIHQIVDGVRLWVLPVVGVYFVVVFSRPGMRAYLDPQDRCGVRRFERPHVD